MLLRLYGEAYTNKIYMEGVLHTQASLLSAHMIVMSSVCTVQSQLYVKKKNHAVDRCEKL